MSNSLLAFASLFLRDLTLCICFLVPLRDISLIFPFVQDLDYHAMRCNAVNLCMFSAQITNMVHVAGDPPFARSPR